VFIMSDDYCDFEFTVGETVHGDVSDYVLAKNPYLGRAFRSAIEALHGPLSGTMTLADAFAAVRAEIVLAAEEKVVALDGEIDQPVPVTGPDICSWPAQGCPPAPPRRAH
jgi:hypothetical protein